jgi:hypothetical protein
MDDDDGAALVGFALAFPLVLPHEWLRAPQP